MAQRVKTPPAMQETQEMQVQSLDQGDPLEEEMATQFTIPAWKIPLTEESGRLHPGGRKVPDTTKQLSTHTLDNGKNHKNISPPLSHQSLSWSSG